MKRTMFLSKHAKDRLRERHDRLLRRYETEREFDLACYELFDAAEVTNRHVNDTRFMNDLYERHGFNSKFVFKTIKNALFIVVDNVCTTVLDMEQHKTTRQFTARPKPNFKKSYA